MNTGPIDRASAEDVAAHASSATINDVVLTAATSALHTLLLSRGDPIDNFVVSVPVSARKEANVTELGNQVGVIALRLPATGDPFERLGTISETTQAAKRTPLAASAALVGSLFRTLGRLGIFRWFINRQRLVHTFTTNLRGPKTHLYFLDAPIIDVVPIAILAGNVTVSFAVLSYCGTLDITVIADPDTCSELDALAEALQRDLDHLTSWAPDQC
ncbi:MAG TPA: WS/DGAT domain-containing protein [Microthrixaceae bacterium]|nr:WS/DGAT domain-containing protein [Microthrixaceae bacterium]